MNHSALYWFFICTMRHCKLYIIIMYFIFELFCVLFCIYFICQRICFHKYQKYESIIHTYLYTRSLFLFLQSFYGNLTEAEGQFGGSQGRRWKVDWDKTPQPIEVKLKSLRGVKDKLPGASLGKWSYHWGSSHKFSKVIQNV